MLTTENTASTKTPSKLWMLSLAVLCIAILAHGLFGGAEASDNFAYLFGYNLPIAAVLAGGLHLFFRKREPAKTGWLGFILVFVSLVAASVLAASQQRTQLRRVSSDIQQSLAAATQPQGNASTNVAPVTSSATGEVGKMEVVLKTMVNRMTAQRREYELELEAVGWSKVLDGERLKDDPTLSQSRVMLKQANDIVARYQSRTDSVYAQIRRDIENSDLTVSSKTSMIAGFDKTAEQGKAQAKELWSLETQVLHKIESVFDLLSARRGSWQIQDGRVMFQRQADLDLYNTYLTNVQSIVARQEQLQAAALKNTKDRLSQLGK